MDHGSNMSNLDDGSRQTAGPNSRRCLFDLGLQQLYRQRYTIGSHQYWPYRTMYRTNPLPSYHSSSRRRPAVVFTKWIRRAFIPARFSRRSALSIVIGTFFALVILNQYHQQQKMDFRTPAVRIGSYNLLEETSSHHSELETECSIDYINRNKVEQDHPCVIDIIRKHFLHPPSPRDAPYNLSEPSDTDPSAGQASFILHRLTYPSGGFFLECGAFDGEFQSNTLYMESTLDWTGILMEPNPKSYEQLRAKNRKAWTLPVCLSIEPYPAQVQFIADEVVGKILNESGQKVTENKTIKEYKPVITAQCFPLYSILLAVNRTDNIDYFSLDVEGHELKVLKTIPWHKVDIKTISVEWEHIEEGEKAVIRFMKDTAKYVLFNRFNFNPADLLFISAKHAND